jgi:hypothetical protein
MFNDEGVSGRVHRYDDSESCGEVCLTYIAQLLPSLTP